MNKLKYFLFTIVLLISSFTHLYRIDHTFIFHNDEARDVLIVKKMIDTKSPVLLGPQTSVGNMYLGPLYYYFMLPPLAIANMNPVGPAIMVGFFGIMTSILLFYIGTRRYGLWAGFIAGLFYAISPVMLHYSRSSWNPNLIPFFATILLLIWHQKSSKSWFILGLIAGVIFQLHYVGLVFVVIAAAAKLRGGLSWRGVILAILGFFISSSPFWVFELRHDFVNSWAFINFLKDGSQPSNLDISYGSRVVNNTKLVIEGIIGSASISLTPIYPALLYFASLLLFLIMPLLRSLRYLGGIIITSILLISILKSPMHVHYISYLFPVVALSFGALSSIGPRITRFATIVVVLILTWLYLPSLVYNLDKIDSIQTKKASEVANYIVQEANGKPYNIVSTAGTYVTTIEYYLSLSSNPPVIDYADLVYDICENNPCPKSDETTTLFYGAGPTHPSISDYIGHPSSNEFKTHRIIQKNERVSHEVWVATMTLDH